MIEARGLSYGLDREFAKFLGRRATAQTRASVELAAGLLSQAVRQGHVCLPLEDPIIGEDSAEIQLPAPANWRKDLLDSGVASQPGGFTPLILDSANRLYLKRYYDYETTLVERLGNLLTQTPSALVWTPEMNALFGTESGPNWQKLAAFTALHRRFCVITGGPGTGKTWTTVRILGLLFEVNPSMRLAMAAPTGRAAARVAESIMAARATLPEPLAARIPAEAGTIHRLLGTIPGSPRFHFNRANPLPFDTVVVDEASMVDLPLMAKLVDALTPDSRLILVGDGDQLSSVQAGNVLADLCLRRNFFSPGLAALARQAGLDFPPQGDPAAPGTALADSVVELRSNQRFDTGGAIQQFCESTRAGDILQCLTISQNSSSNLRLIEVRNEKDIDALLRKYTTEFVLPRITSGAPRENLLVFARSRVLCAHRSGGRGVEGINRRIESILAEAGNIRFGGASYYPGRPLMVTMNDYQQGLFNGDTGLIVGEEEPGTGERAVFGMEGGELRYFHPAQLPAHETAYATSVHKSQGSEFEHVVLILPEKSSRILSRELVYTAASRARSTVEIWGSSAVLEAAIERQVKRFSGLSDRLG